MSTSSSVFQPKFRSARRRRHGAARLANILWYLSSPQPIAGIFELRHFTTLEHELRLASVAVPGGKGEHSRRLFSTLIVATSGGAGGTRSASSWRIVTVAGEGRPTAERRATLRPTAGLRLMVAIQSVIVSNAMMNSTSRLFQESPCRLLRFFRGYTIPSR